MKSPKEMIRLALVTGVATLALASVVACQPKARSSNPAAKPAAILKPGEKVTVPPAVEGPTSDTTVTTRFDETGIVRLPIKSLNGGKTALVIGAQKGSDSVQSLDVSIVDASEAKATCHDDGVDIDKTNAKACTDLSIDGLKMADAQGKMAKVDIRAVQMKDVKVRIVKGENAAITGDMVKAASSLQEIQATVTAESQTMTVDDKTVTSFNYMITDSTSKNSSIDLINTQIGEGQVLRIGSNLLASDEKILGDVTVSSETGTDIKLEINIKQGEKVSTLVISLDNAQSEYGLAKKKLPVGKTYQGVMTLNPATSSAPAVDEAAKVEAKPALKTEVVPGSSGVQENDSEEAAEGDELAPEAAAAHRPR